MSVSMPPLPPEPERYVFGAPFAAWWRRVVAQLIDSLLPAVPVIAFGMLLHATTLIDRGPEALWGVLIAVVIVTTWPLYYGLTMRRPGDRNGQTWGKQWLQIRVVRADRTALRGWFSVLREVLVKYLLLGFCGLVQLVDGLWPLWDDRRQALHDKIVSTYVVRA